MRKRPIAAFFSAFALSVATALHMDTLPPGQRKLEELFNAGGPSWHPYPSPSRGSSGAAAFKRAARKRRNVRARAAKR